MIQGTGRERFIRVAVFEGCYLTPEQSEGDSEATNLGRATQADGTEGANAQRWETFGMFEEHITYMASNNLHKALSSKYYYSPLPFYR